MRIGMEPNIETRSTPRRRRDPSGTAIKAMLNIAAKWALTESDIGTLMGGVSIPTVRRWKRQLRDTGRVQSPLGRDQLDRVSYLLGIYKALHILFPDPSQADGWVRRANNGAGFEGRSALDVMRQGGMEDLRQVRRYLDGWRG